MHLLRQTCARLTCAAAALGLFAAAAPAAELTKYLPADTELVVYVNVRQVLDAPLVKKHAMEQLKAALNGNANAKNFLAAAGLDPFKDVDSLVLSSPGSASAEKVVILAKGKFNVAKIVGITDDFAKTNPDQLKIHKEGGLRVYEGKSKDEPNATFVAFLDEQTMLVSPSKDYLLQAAKKEGKVKKELAALLDKTDAKQSVWMVALPSEDLRKLLANNPQTADIADKLTAFTGNVVVADAVQADIHVHTQDAKTAESVHKLLDGVKGIVSFAAQNIEDYGPLISDVIDAFKISSDKSTVSLSAKITEALIEKGLKKDKK